MVSKEEEKTAVEELQEFLEENPEVLKELDAGLIRVCEKLEVL